MELRKYIAVLAMAFCAACSDDEDLLSQQQQSIVSFLTGSHTPRLLSEEDAAQSLDNNPAYYSTFGGTTYRYIADVYDADRLTRAEVTAGSRVDVTFSLYTFSGRTPTQTDCVYSNDATMIDRLVAAGLNPARWVECDEAGVPILDEQGQFVPYALVLQIGDGSTMPGLQEALIGCREQDEVELYMTYNQAYGDKEIVGLVPKSSSVAFFCTIDKVTK